MSHDPAFVSPHKLQVADAALMRFLEPFERRFEIVAGTGPLTTGTSFRLRIDVRLIPQPTPAGAGNLVNDNVLYHLGIDQEQDLFLLNEPERRERSRATQTARDRLCRCQPKPHTSAAAGARTRYRRSGRRARRKDRFGAIPGSVAVLLLGPLSPDRVSTQAGSSRIPLSQL